MRRCSIACHPMQRKPPDEIPLVRGCVNARALQHRFDPDMECEGCGIGFAQLQAAPDYCPYPVREEDEEAA